MDYYSAYTSAHASCVHFWKGPSLCINEAWCRNSGQPFQHNFCTIRMSTIHLNKLSEIEGNNRKTVLVCNSIMKIFWYCVCCFTANGRALNSSCHSFILWVKKKRKELYQSFKHPNFLFSFIPLVEGIYGKSQPWKNSFGTSRNSSMHDLFSFFFLAFLENVSTCSIIDVCSLLVVVWVIVFKHCNRFMHHCLLWKLR